MRNLCSLLSLQELEDLLSIIAEKQKYLEPKTYLWRCMSMKIVTIKREVSRKEIYYDMVLNQITNNGV